MPKPSLQCPPSPNNTGAYRLAWEGRDGSTYELRENDQPLYRGVHHASTVTGREAGNYQYRVGLLVDGRSSDVQWSNNCTVSVSPPSLLLTGMLFGAGLLVFLSTAAVIIRGHRQHRRGELS